MKQPFLLFIIFSLLVASSCKKDESTPLTKSDFRIKMEIGYYNRHLENKIEYLYTSDQIDQIRYSINPFDGSLPNFSGFRQFEYDDDILVEAYKSYAGDQAVSGYTNEYEFDGGVIIRKNDEEFKYSNGLLIEREIPDNSKTTYEYENGNLVLITVERFYNATNEYIPYTKYELEYTGEQVTCLTYPYQRNTSEWGSARKYDYYYSGESLIKEVRYSSDNTTISSTYEYKYDSQQNLIQYISENSITYYDLIYDEFNNIIEKNTTSSSSSDTRRALYYYEVGKSNLNTIKVPPSPGSYDFFHNLKKSSNEN